MATTTTKYDFAVENAAQKDSILRLSRRLVAKGAHPSKMKALPKDFELDREDVLSCLAELAFVSGMCRADRCPHWSDSTGNLARAVYSKLFVDDEPDEGPDNLTVARMMVLMWANPDLQRARLLVMKREVAKWQASIGENIDDINF